MQRDKDCENIQEGVGSKASTAEQEEVDGARSLRKGGGRSIPSRVSKATHEHFYIGISLLRRCLFSRKQARKYIVGRWFFPVRGQHDGIDIPPLLLWDNNDVGNDILLPLKGTFVIFHSILSLNNSRTNVGLDGWWIKFRSNLSQIGSDYSPYCLFRLWLLYEAWQIIIKCLLKYLNYKVYLIGNEQWV